MKQRGSSPLLIVVLLLLTGSLLLQASERILRAGMPGGIDEYHYLQDFCQASSSLAWGLQQRWADREGWQCRQSPEEGWRSCLLWQTRERGVLRGQSANGETLLWRWVQPQNAERSALMAIPAGWSDLCPLPDERECRQGL